MLSAGCSAVRGATMAHRLGRLIQRRIATELLSTRTTSGTPAASTASLEQVRTDQPAIFSGPHASHKVTPGRSPHAVTHIINSCLVKVIVAFVGVMQI